MSVKPETYYKDFIHDFRESIMNHNVSLVYEGEMSQEIVSIFSKIAQAKMDGNEHDVTKKRVHHVLVECLENICNHGDEKEKGGEGVGKGILLVGNNESEYMVTTGNLVENSHVDSLVSTLNWVNALSPQEIKEEYKKGVISNKSIEGLGFIDMIKKTGNPVQFSIKKVDEAFSFLVISSKVDRIKKD